MCFSLSPVSVSESEYGVLILASIIIDVAVIHLRMFMKSSFVSDILVLSLHGELGIDPCVVLGVLEGEYIPILVLDFNL